MRKILTIILICFSNFLFSQGNRNIDYNGIWRSALYGETIEIINDSVIIYQEAGEKLLKRQFTKATIKDNTIKMLNSGPFGGTPSYYELFLSDDILTLFETHSESKYHYQKIEQKPEVIENSDNSYLNLQYFWNMHNERYPYFAERNIDWNNAKKYIEALDNSQLSEENLWEHLKVLVDYFNNDGHIWIADKKGETFYTPVNSGVKKAIRPKKELLLMLGEKYLDNHQYQTLGNGKIIYKFLPDSIGYINIMSFYQMSKAESKVKQLEDLSRDLDSLYNYFTEAKGLIIDVRYNGGGNDWNSLFCAGLFTSQNIPVLSKRPRIQGTNRYGPPEIYQAFAHKNNFANFEKIILSSGFSGSATESCVFCYKKFIDHW